ncbi:retinoic acid-induced protein 1 isoform X2 [Kryptolebias marmoratus]|uniref:retinoic acid-induced protein 1 isoform X2 n=1 Tax=Kryptolebias marmoratus TaxID=37003 RepID=UPI0007F8ECFD|nr:retinoic acid-induced protein 1 isoform X2 [Kryptolebias marmoratus]
MEQPPGSLDDLQPQNVSTSTMPTVINLSRREEDHALASTPHAVLRMVKSPGWYPDSRTASEAGSSDVTPQPGEHVQPDNALSHTTVTVSYKSRSHVISARSPLSQRSPLYSVSPISRFSFHPQGGTDNGVGESSYALSQGYSERAEEPVNLAAQSEAFRPFPRAQAGPGSDAGSSRVQEPLGSNGREVSGDRFAERPPRDNEACELPEEARNGLENGQNSDGWSSSGALNGSSLETCTLVREEEEQDEERGSSVLFVLSEKQDSAVVSDSAGATNLCSFSREYRSPLEDPVSPSATSLDDVEDVFLLPQASSSPSVDTSYPERDEGDSERPPEWPAQPSSGVSHDPATLVSGDETEQPAHGWKATSEPSTDESENNRVVLHINGNAATLETTLTGRKLPARLGRGTRLEAIVMNINSSRYKVSGRILGNKKTSASQSTPPDSTLSTSQRSGSFSRRRGKVKLPFSVKQKVPVKKRKRGTIKSASCNDSAAVSEPDNKTKSCSGALTKSPRCGRSKREPARPPHISSVRSRRNPSAVHRNSKKEPELLSQPELSAQTKVPRFSPPLPQSKSPKKNPGKTKSKSPASEVSPTAKTKPARTPKRRRKKPRRSQTSSIFSPKEPEIKLKYVNYREERRDPRLDAFSSFVRVERQESSPALCTLINYPEDVTSLPKKGQQQQAFISAAVPTTSCLRLGRPSTHSQHRRALACCLCGQSANAMDLGDLHGPYYPEGHRPSAKAPAGGSGFKEDDYSDSDSSSFSVRAMPRALAQAAHMKQKGPLARSRWAGDGASSPEAKRPRPDAGPADAQDWYSPPVLPQEPCEYWLHEDCGVWSAGVFLVKGRVYGLEEAVKVAQETMCSACHAPGATLGCFFKGCANKYHYSGLRARRGEFLHEMQEAQEQDTESTSREPAGRQVTVYRNLVSQDSLAAASCRGSPPSPRASNHGDSGPGSF